jgi:hypothetical protein
MLTAYCDGSHKKNRISWGFLIVENHSRIIALDSGRVTDARVTGARNVAGELSAVMHAVKWFHDNDKVGELAVDFELPVKIWNGTAKKFKHFATYFFAEFLNLNRKHISRIYKVDSHGANKWQNKVDKIARQAADPMNFEVKGKPFSIQLATAAN